MRLLGAAVVAWIMLGCGGRAGQTAPDDTPTAGTGGTNAAGGAGAGGASVPNNLLVACAPQVGGAEPRPVCTTDYAVGLACDPTTFQICTTPDYLAVIWCGVPGFCMPVTLPAADAGGANPCVGSCSMLDQTCQWQINNGGGGVSPYVCCRDDDGGLAWTSGNSCVIGPR